ncbi:hypothetical protein QQX98_002572 [Neonectria punicea]|uniref:Uncharacterized protein n=1 Tax=Neonectria punicea TaxID=979145 RepID=A0ABR1HJ61_9HYPO
MKRSAPVDDDDVALPAPKRQDRFPVQRSPASSVSAAVPLPEVIDLASNDLASDGLPYEDYLDDGPEYRTFRDEEAYEEQGEVHRGEKIPPKPQRSQLCGCKGRCGNPFYRMSEIFAGPEGTPATETRPHDCFAEWFRHESLSHPEHTTLEYIFETIYASLCKDHDPELRDAPTSWKDRWDAAGVADRDASDPDKREMMRELRALAETLGQHGVYLALCVL